MTTLFVIDTAGDACSLALLHEGALDVSRGPAGHNHLEHVMPMVEALFARNGLTPGRCDAFAYASGPGSFTGLRIACTIVQGLAMGADRPVIGVGNLLALTAGATGDEDATGGPCRVLAAVDARMQQAYVAIHEGAGTAWQELLPPSVIDTSALPGLVARWRPALCAGEAGWLEAGLSAGASGGVPPVRDTRVEANVLVRLALARLARGEVLAPQDAVPQYVRDDVARTVAQRQAARLAGVA